MKPMLKSKTIRMESEMFDKLTAIAKAECRSLEKQMLFFLINDIAEYERVTSQSTSVAPQASPPLE